MINLLSDYKVYILGFVIIGMAALNISQQYRLSKVENQLQVCQGNLAANMVAINLAKDLQAYQEKKLRLKEQDAAKARVESLKRMDEIMKLTVPEECNQAVIWGIERANELKFHWDNNIP
jgi:hypothetical protein